MLVTDGEARRRPGRPQAPVLTRDRITRVALQLAERRGHRALTVDALARELAVSKSALYNHAASKATLFVWMQDAINATIDTSAFATTDWSTAVTAWARSYREAYARYPQLVPLMATQPIADAPRTAAMYEAVARGLVAGGWDVADVLNVVVAVEAFVFGAALDIGAPDDIFDARSASDEAPTIASAVDARAARHGVGRDAADAAFELGLAALLDGLAARRG